MAERANTRRDRTRLPYGKKIGPFRIIKCIGQGGYGDVYYVTPISGQDSSQALAMKLELTNARKQGLRKEKEFMEQVQGSVYFPRLISFGEYHKYRYMVIDMLGPSLSNLRRCCPKERFSLSTLVRIGQMTLKMIQEFHERGMVHRDIKPSNFLLRPGSPDFLCLIDFGLSKFYVDREGELLPPLEHAGFKGTLKYASPGAHYGDDQGRRDDMFSWIYSMVECLESKLPWSDVKGKTHVLKCKRRYHKSEELRNLPFAFKEMLRHIEKLKFGQVPDYQFLHDKLDECFEQYGLDRNAPFDWESIGDEKAKAISLFPLARPADGRPVTMFDISEIVDKEAIERAKKRRERRQKEKEENNGMAGSNSRQKPRVASVTCLLI